MSIQRYLGTPAQVVRWVGLAAIAMFVLLVVMASCQPQPAHAAMWAEVVWTNPLEPVDSLRAVQVRAPGDTVAMTIYELHDPVATKRLGAAGASDSARVSISTANIVGPAALRVVLFAHNGGGWSGPSNAVSLFYAARDTLYLGPPAGNQPNPDWWRGPGLFGYSQPLGDTSWPSWQHCEVAQASVRTRLCAIYGYACRRGVRDTIWCSSP